MKSRRILLAVAAAIACASFAVSAAYAQTDQGPTLSQTVRRGHVSCGVVEAPGFAERDSGGDWRGFDVEFCRAVASAIFDDPAKVRFMNLTPKDRINTLQAGWIDILASAPSWTQSRDGGQQLIYAGVAFHDGQAFLVRRQRGFTSAQDLSGVSVCAQMGTSFELELADFFDARKAVYEAKLFATFEEAVESYANNQCDALTADTSALYAERSKLASPSEHAVLPDMLSKAPRGPLTRQGDDQWLNIVRWTLFAMLDAEELSISMSNVDEALKSKNPHVRRMLGVDGDAGADLGLPRDWAYRVVKHVGNYADMFERNLGQASPLAMDRRLNSLWKRGGLMYAPPVR